MKDEKTDNAVARAMFYICFDDTIILKEANDVYLTQHEISYSDIGKNIRELLSSEEVMFFSVFANRYRGGEFVYRYIKYSGENNIPWKVKLTVSYPYIEYNGYELLKNNTLPWKSGKLIYSSAEYAITFIKKADEFNVELSENIPKTILDNFVTDGVCRHDLLKNILCECLKKKQSMSFVENVNQETVESLVKITVIPVSSEKSVTVIRELPAYDAFGEHCDTTDHILFEDIIGTAVVSCSKAENVFAENMNPLMTSLVKGGKLTKTYIISSYPFQSAIMQGSVSVGIIKYADDSGSCLLLAVPFLKNGVVVKVAVMVLPLENCDMMDRSLLYGLTSREYNVINLAAMGMNTKMISESLNISEGTAKKQLFSCYKKLDVNNRIEMIRKLYHL